ncbi:hypothetical protein BIV57_11450 [Mangrovactinospora gilvigrisea]|uniref:Uncharacterized protein n=1 Tax=Mangrovactinospora gilvigrisea TaxID=1428644 RepID=A0A1J7BF68_9ACTN|nr:hypothetical protein BIV57_11450 [Mangrovactinospora gilvigrisea]
MSLQDDVYAARRDLEHVERAVARLRAELDALTRRLPPGVVPSQARPPEDVIHVPDAPYDPALWRDVDDEGIGRREVT